MSDLAAGLAAAASTPRRLKWYAAGAAAGVALGAATIVLAFEKFAPAEDVVELRQGASMTRGDLEGLRTRVTHVEDGQGAIIDGLHRIEADYHQQRDQLWELAKTSGAKVVPAPHGDR